MRRYCLIIALVLLPGLAGCNPFSKFAAARQDVVIPPTAAITPPVGSIPASEVGPGGLIVSPTPPGAVLVPALNRDLVWDQVVDIIDDYFRIEREERVKLIGNTLIEGRIDTFPITGATLLEPWHRDSVGFYNRLESTLQSIRRRADVRVIPVEQGFLIDVVVMKDLEIVDRPIKASAGAATFRYDDSLNRDTEFDPDPNRLPGDPARPIGPRAANSGWKYLGRDTDLEQVILGRIAERLGGVPAPSAGPGVGTATVGTPSQTPQFIGPGFQALPTPTPATIAMPNAGTLPPAGIVMPPSTELPAPGVGALPPGGVILPQPLPRP